MLESCISDKPLQSFCRRQTAALLRRLSFKMGIWLSSTISKQDFYQNFRQVL